MAEMVGTNYDTGRRAAAPSPDVRVATGELPVQRGFDTVSARGAAPTFITPGAGAEKMNDVAGDFAATQAEAQQQTWLMNASSNYDLQARNAMDEAQRNTAPGDSIMPKLQSSLADLKNQNLQGIDSPLLQQKFTQQMQQTQSHVMDQAQQYDFQERDRNTDFNFQQGLNNMATRIGASKSYDEANQTGQNYLGQALQTIQDTPALPEQKMKWTMEARGLMGQASNTAMMNLDGQRWVADHSSAFPAQVAESVGVPRGIRNNNPGNLEGDTQFQGQTGTDKGGYATFATPEDGLRAMALNLKNQQDLHGLQTVQDIITKWAPPSENNTAAYVQDVSQKLGVDPNQKLNLHDPAVLKTFTSAIISHENNGASPYHDQSLDWAVNSALGNDPGQKPDAARADGSTVAGNPLWNVMTYEEQQKMANEYVTKQRQERTILADYRREATTLYQNLNQNMTKGIMPGDDELKQLNEAASQSGSPAIVAQAQHLQQISNTANTVRQMNPTDLNGYIQHLNEMPQSLDRDNSLAYAQKFQQAQGKQLQSDPVSFYSQVGHPVPPVDFNNPTTLQARATMAHNLSQNYGTDINKSFFTPAEANQLVHTFQNSDLDTKRQMLWKFSQGFGADTPAAASVFSKSLPNFGYAASLLGSAPTQTPDGPTVQTAMDIIAGDERMKQDKNKVVSKTQVDNGLKNAGIDKVFANSPQAYDQVANATQALYAARQNDNSNPGKLKDYALEALGTKTASVGGNRVLAPVGVDPDEFQNFAKSMTPQQIQGAMTDAYGYLKGQSSNMMEMPRNADGAFDPAKNKMILRTIGPNLYAMVGENGKNYTTPDGPAILRITADTMKAK